MRTAVIVPPLRDFYFTRHRFSCLGAKTVCRIITQNNHSAAYFCFPLSPPASRTIALPKELARLAPFMIPDETGKTSFFTRYHHFGPSFEHCARDIAAVNPEICFISVFAYGYASDALETAAAIKKRLPHSPVAVGGAGVCAYPEYFIRHASVDYALSGEAETNLQPFLRCVKENNTAFDTVPGCLWKDRNGNIHSSSSPAPCPGPQIACSHSITASNRHTVSLSLSVSRGCGHACRFCSSFLAHGRTFRCIPLENVLHYIDAIMEQIRLEPEQTLLINFEDDNLLNDTTYLISLMKHIRQKKHLCAFAMENGIDYRLLSIDMVRELIALGFRKFNLSLGTRTGFQSVAENRKTDVHHFTNIIHAIQRGGINDIVTYFICGLKNDTPQSIASLLAFLCNVPTSIGISPYYAVPGLADFRNKKLFDTLPPSYSLGSSAYPWFDSGPDTRRTVTAFRLSRYINLATSNRRSAIEQELINITAKTRHLHTIIKQNKKARIIPCENVDTELQHHFFCSPKCRVGMLNHSSPDQY